MGQSDRNTGGVLDVTHAHFRHRRAGKTFIRWKMTGDSPGGADFLGCACAGFRAKFRLLLETGLHTFSDAEDRGRHGRTHAWPEHGG